MLKITFEKDKNDIIEKVTFKGHAMFDVYGKDIVCASASSILITTVNAIIEFDKDSIEYDNKENFILKNIKKDDITNKLLKNMYELLKELESKYKDNIKINE